MSVSRSKLGSFFTSSGSAEVTFSLVLKAVVVDHPLTVGAAPGPLHTNRCTGGLGAKLAGCRGTEPSRSSR